MSDITVVGTVASTTPATGNITFKTLKSDIATYFGMDKDPEKDAFIGRIVHDIIDDLNSKKLWRFNLIKAATITSTAGKPDYALPADLWQLYSVRKEDDIDYQLTTLRERQFDVLFQSQNNIDGFPYVTALFNIYRDGTLRLFPTPDSTYQFTLRYFQLITKPSSDGEPLDMPSPFQVVCKYGALARLAALVDSRTVGYWENKFGEAYQDANARDEDTGDEDLRFMNVEEMDARNMAFINPALRPRYLDFY